MSKLLALDQSSTITGYAIFEDGQPITISHFSAGTGDLGKRLVKIRNTIIQLIEDNDIDEVVFEDIQLQTSAGNNVKTFKILAEVFGVVHETLQEQDVDFTIVPPIVWKATFKFAGKGREKEKKLAQQWVLENYNLKCTEDEADAACLGTHVIKSAETVYDWS